MTPGTQQGNPGVGKARAQRHRAALCSDTAPAGPARFRWHLAACECKSPAEMGCLSPSGTLAQGQCPPKLGGSEEPGGKRWDTEAQTPRRRRGISLERKSRIKILSPLKPPTRHQGAVPVLQHSISLCTEKSKKSEKHPCKACIVPLQASTPGLLQVLLGSEGRIFLPPLFRATVQKLSSE